MTEPTKTTPPPLDRPAYERLLQRVSFLREWLQPTIEGIEHIPSEEGALLVTNHGHFGIDLPVLLTLILEGTGRAVRSLGDRVVFATPFFRDWAHMMGAVEGEPTATVRLLQDDQLVLVYPGGAREALGDPKDAYRLQWESSHGFIRTALRAQKPIIPIAGLGNEELYVQVVFISKVLGDKYVTPIYMGLGLLPFPAELHYIVGEPIRLPYGPEAAEDREIVAQLHRQVAEAAQKLIDRGLEERKIAGTGTDTGTDTGTGTGTGTDTDTDTDAGTSRDRLVV
jgi:1-acyl-sn-glycerol-3-phosphate acyltransferase